MEALVIKSNNKKEMKLLKEVVEKMGLQSTKLSAAEMEDLGLSMLMKQTDRSEKVSRDEIMRKLEK